MGASTVRIATATDFKTVSVPALTASSLTDSVTPGRTPAPVGRFAIAPDASSADFYYPQDPDVTRWVTVTNTGQQLDALGFRVSITGPDRKVVDADSIGVFPHPQPNVLYLEPGESQNIWVILNWFDLNSQNWQPGKTYDYTITIKVFPRIVYPAERAPAGTQTVTLKNSIHDVPFGPIDPATNATIAGCVYDAATHEPIPNAAVSAMDHWSMFPGSADTDAQGSFSLGLRAHLVALAGIWQPWTMTVTAPGYRDASITIAPQDGDHETANIALERASESASYQLTAKIDTGGLNVNRGVISKDGRYIATTQFHTELAPGSDRHSLEGATVAFFDTSSERLLWQFPLLGESPAIAIADDGSLVATARPGGAVYVLDRDGHVVWNVGSAVSTTVYEVRFSHSKQYLAVGDIAGNLYLLDLGLRKVVWHRFLRGQVRALEFEQDDGTLYAGAGDGYVYDFDITGHVAWRAYVGGWPAAFAVSRDYLFASGKEGYFVSLLDKHGATLWQYPVRQSASLATIAPDQTYFVAQGNGNNVATMIFSPDGVLQHRFANADPGAISADSNYIVLSGENFAPPGPNPHQSIWIKLIDRSGNVLWRDEDIGETGIGGSGGFAWISDDGRRIVVTSGEWVFFFDGSITRL